MNSVPTVNALSIDVEEHFQVHAFSQWIRPEDWAGHTSRVAGNTKRLLALLGRYDVRATFFVVGWVAERHPELIQQIADMGHEIGSHSYWHKLVYEQTPNEFAEDLDRSLEAITHAVPNVTIAGYRAPSFSITKETLWAQDILLDHGLKYDSSIFPVSMHHRYGIGDASRFAHRLSSGLWEFPMSTVSLAKRNLPVAGGGYFRLYPLWLTQMGIDHINAEEQPAILYLHPWEIDPEQPRVREASPLARFRHYVNMSKVESRLEHLLQNYTFAPMAQVFADELASFEAEQQVGYRYPKHNQAYENHYSDPGRAILPAPSARRIVPKTVR